MGRRDSNPKPNPESFRGCSIKWRTARLKLRVADSFFVLESARFCVLRPLRELLRRNKFNLASETMRCVIAAAFMLGHSAFKIVGRTYVITPSAPQNVNASHRKKHGSAGTRTRNQRLKRALLCQSYRIVLLFYCCFRALIDYEHGGEFKEGRCNSC